MADNKNVSDVWDFTGIATKSNIKCTDGRIIAPDAFKHMDGQQVTLVWRHMQHEPGNILGHGLLEARDGDMLVHGKFNPSENGKIAKIAVEHGDIKSLSIFANNLIERNHIVHSGDIVEVSLVVSGANPGAKITNVMIRHEDTGEEVQSEEEAVIQMGIPPKADVYSSETSEETIQHANTSTEDSTVEEVLTNIQNKLDPIEVDVINALLAKALSTDNSAAQADTQEGENFMSKNVFENEEQVGRRTASLTHEQEAAVFAEAQRCGSLRTALMHAAPTYGIENIDYLFPDARTVGNEPALIRRDNAWVSGWMSGTNHTPFSRIKTMNSDITADTARALGYIKAGMKKEIVLKLLQRVTTPTTVYIKAKLDRDDIIDVTTMDVVAWQQRIMRFQLDEEVARAALIGDGRPLEVNAAANPDKINEDNIRPIYSDDELYTHRMVAAKADTVSDIIDQMIAVREFYKGTGTPTFYTTTAFLTKMLLLKDEMGRRMYRSVDELASELRVKDIVEVPVLSGVSREDTGSTINLLGILVNPADYTYGADRGGGVASFEDFDIDYNQMKWLLETRLSGALTLPKSAIAVEQNIDA